MSPKQQAVLAFLRDHPEVKGNRWAKLAGCSEGTIRRIKTEENAQVTDEVFEKLDKAAIQLKGYSLRSRGKNRAFLVGRVGAGAMVHIFDGDSSQGIREAIDFPLGIDSDGDVEALEIEGDSMMPFKSGWRVFYRYTHLGVTSEEINKLCVVVLRNGARYVKEVRTGYAPGKYNLVSWSADQMDNQEIEWAAKVLSIVPR